MKSTSVPASYLAVCGRPLELNHPSKYWQAQIRSAGGPRSGSRTTKGNGLTQPLRLLSCLPRLTCARGCDVRPASNSVLCEVPPGICLSVELPSASPWPSITNPPVNVPNVARSNLPTPSLSQTTTSPELVRSVHTRSTSPSWSTSLARSDPAPRDAEENDRTDDPLLWLKQTLMILFGPAPVTVARSRS